MKFHAVFVLVVVILVGVVTAANVDKDVDANKDIKEQWLAKKEKHRLHVEKKKHHRLGGDLNENEMDYDKKDYDLDSPVEYKGQEGETKTHKLKHYFGPKFHKKSKKYAAGKKMKKVHKTMSWLDVRTDGDCEFMCKTGEVCISGPVVDKPICVMKKDLKKSMKMFHRYHKKELKDWRKYQKKYYKKDWDLKEEKYGKLGKKLNKEDLRRTKKEMMNRLSKEELAALKKEKRQKLGKSHRLERKFHKKVKPHFNAHPRKTETVCGPNEMAEMKTRMNGWFHLLHGQDHEARKAHGGSIAKFYKHVSAKKELREHNGEKCQCMKSAMWQLQQMDKNHDEHLTDTELQMLEENTLEPCMTPYLHSCDKDDDKKISSDEWCCCFTNVLPPCYKRLNEIRQSGEPVTYMPRCDKEGYYMHEQCKGGDSGIPLTCWCVDYNGNEYQDTRQDGRAHCHKIAKYGKKQTIPLA